MTKSEIEARVREIVAEQFGLESDALDRDDELWSYPDADHMDLLEIERSLEEAFDVEISVHSNHTVRDLVGAIAEYLGIDG